MMGMAEYIWMDGNKPTQTLRSKARVIQSQDEMKLEDFPEWGYDGSSTYQATGDDSDLKLIPVSFVNDPIRGQGNYLVMCEVMNPDGTPHPTNTRAKLREALANGGDKLELWLGFEQEHTLMSGDRPLGWPQKGFPAPQGPFYCGVGADEVYGREVVEAHSFACIEAGLMIYGINAEVMPGQWEFQIGYRGVDSESADPLTVCDHLWLARWLLYRVGEDFEVSATLHPKPIHGDWNGAGKHTNFSTKMLRDAGTGKEALDDYIVKLRDAHMKHIKHYGAQLEERLTGDHETSPIDEFSSGVSDRGCSIRIPMAFNDKGCGYLEDRRPGANADPYRVANCLVSTLAGIEINL